MAEYIEREALKQSIRNMPRPFHPELVFKSSVQKIISNAPAADVVEVVRCKDCIHRGRPQCGFWFDDSENKIQERWDYPDGFCSYGERKDGAE